MRNEYTVTKRLMKSWAKGWYFNYSIDKILFVCCYTAFILFTPYLFINLVHFLVGDDLESIHHMVFVALHTEALLFLAFCLFLPRVSYVSQYNINRKNFSVESWKRVIDLTEEEIIVTDHKSLFKYQYRTITRVKERGNVVHIFLKSGTEIIIQKDAFVSGSWDECKRLISGKSSVKVR